MLTGRRASLGWTAIGRSLRGMCLVFFVLIGLIHGEAAEFIGYFQQVLVALVPFGAHLAEKHRSLIRPAQLHVSYFAQVSAEPAGIVHIVSVSELGVAHAMDHVIRYLL